MKTVVITGGSRGIGRACALKFAREGFCVVLTYRKNESAAKEVLEEIVPANIVINAYLMYNTHGFLRRFTHEEMGGYTHRQLMEEELE